MRWLPAVLIPAALLLPVTAEAAPSPNDRRADVQVLTLPASVSGSTQDTTLEPDEPSACSPLRGSLWYQVRAPDITRIVVRLEAQGDLDCEHRRRAPGTLPVAAGSVQSDGR